MTCLAKHASLENLRSCDRSMQSQSCADGCLAGDVYSDVFMSWWQLGACGSLPARNLNSQNYKFCKYRHGLVVRLKDGNHSNHPKDFCTKIYIFEMSLLRHYFVIIASLLRGECEIKRCLLPLRRPTAAATATTSAREAAARSCPPMASAALRACLLIPHPLPPRQCVRTTTRASAPSARKSPESLSIPMPILSTLLS